MAQRGEFRYPWVNLLDLRVANRVLDGTGRQLADAVVEVRGDTIVAVDQRRGAVTHDLGQATLLPGLIDVHVHVGYHFGKDGRAQNTGETPGEMALVAAENAWVTLKNAREMMTRVREGGQSPMDAVVRLQADILAVDGNPLDDIAALRCVSFVMPAGTVYEH